MPKVGDILNGTVVKILKAGALVQISEKETGFLHISEISKDYVKNVNDYVKVGDKVKVRVVNLNPVENRMYLSIRLVDEELFHSEKDKEKQKHTPKVSSPKPKTPQKKKEEDPTKIFENKIARFLKDSQDKLRTIQKNKERKQGIRKKPRPNNK